MSSQVASFSGELQLKTAEITKLAQLSQPQDGQIQHLAENLSNSVPKSDYHNILQAYQYTSNCLEELKEDSYSSSSSSAADTVYIPSELQSK